MEQLVNGHASNSLAVGVAVAPAAPVSEDTGVADSLSPSQVGSFIRCPAAWYYRTVLGLPDPVNANRALGIAVDDALTENYRQKIETREDLETEGVVALYRSSWAAQQDAIEYQDKEDPKAIGEKGVELVRLYMDKAAPTIQPIAVQQRLAGMIGGVRVNARLDLLDETGQIHDYKVAAKTPSDIDQMYRMNVTTYARLEPRASGFVRLDTLTKTKEPKLITQAWKVEEPDNKAIDALYPLVQAAARSGYYVPARASMFCSRTGCGHWRVCEKDFGGKVRGAGDGE